MRIHVSSLGCKLNQSEMEALTEALGHAGHKVVASPAGADLCILNTCAVTGVAAQKSRQAVRRLHRENPAARLVVTGCYAELDEASLRELPGVELVAGNREKERLAELLGGGRVAQSAGLPDGDGQSGGLPYMGRTRSLVKIQDGCDNACTYCIIHVARGRQRSRPADEILSEIEARLAAGYREIVLTGVHIGAYGRDEGESREGIDLWSLVERILAETDVARLRLSSIEPWDFREEALRLWQDPRLCRHLHLPLQSGCDATLRRMGRHYGAGQFLRTIGAARAAVPNLAVTSDVIVGFPGETDEEFAESLATVQAAGLARVHVFPFSRRPGTPADGMAGQVPPPVKEARARAMRAASAAGSLAFRRRFVGRTIEVLWESVRPGAEGAVWSGLTDNYLRVQAPSAQDLRNTLTPTRLMALEGDGFRGEIEAK